MKKPTQKIKLTQLDWVNFTHEEQVLLNTKEPQIQNKSEVLDLRTEYQILKDLGQLDLLD